MNDDTQAGLLTEGEAVHALQEAALTGTSPHARSAFQLDIHLRLFDQLLTGASPADTVALVRQLLRREHYRHSGGGDQSFLLPNVSGWVSDDILHRHGCSSVRSADQVRLRAHPWRPDWLPVDGEFRDEAVAAHLPIAQRRVPDTVPADPFFPGVLGEQFLSYQTAAQRQAVRAAAAMAPGTTLIVNLPTGSGKTEVALGPAFFEARTRGVSVIFVPTISLAQDLDRRIQEILAATGRPVAGTVAFTGDTVQGDRQDIRRGVANGTLPVVITTPESGTGALHESLRHAAHAGFLRYFVVDEAHLIRVWGIDFRPEFQQLAGLRRELLNVAPPSRGVKTLLLSATFTAADLDYLTAQFSEHDAVDLIAANALRPEPDYWTAHAPDEATRQQWVLDAIAHLPRPIFLYTSWIDDADMWVDRLRAAGYQRVARVTGTVPGLERRGVIDRLRGETVPTSVDVVVATSAFGLGISFDQVRTVIHACLPESIDRLYQEVGRAGRDGYASVALCAWTDEDRDRAAPLARAVVIGYEKAEKRWRAMTTSPLASTDTRGNISVDLTAVPSYLPRRGDLNVAWNRATLALMARAEFVSLETTASTPESDSDSSRWIDRMLVYPKVGHLANSHVWRSRWVQVAMDIHNETRIRRDAVDIFVQPGTRVCDVLVEAYRAIHSHLGFDGTGLTPRLSCGQCAGCGFEGPRSRTLPEPEPIQPSLLHQSARDHLRWTGLVPVLVPPVTTAHERADVERRFLEIVMRYGVSIVALDRSMPIPPALASAHRTESRPIFLADYLTDSPWMLPGLSMGVIGPLDGDRVRPNWLLPGDQPTTFILISETSPSFHRADRSIGEVRPVDSVSLRELEDYG